MPSDYNTGVAQLRITKEGDIESYFIPCRFSNGVTSMLSEDDEMYDDIINDLNGMSLTATVDSDRHIIKN
jgi:poly-gamma-glutamate synthesis protein (capsule biosynthesis protein)